MGSNINEEELIEITRNLNPKVVLRVFLTFFILFIVYLLFYLI